LPKNKTYYVQLGNSYGVKVEAHTNPQFHWGLFTTNSYGVKVEVHTNPQFHWGLFTGNSYGVYEEN